MNAVIEIERATTLVTIDLRRLSDMGYLVPSASRSRLADEFRIVKRVLLGNVANDANASGRASLIVVTSALPGEGKTFCAVNLAMSMAMEVDTTVLLVDADVLRPSLLPRLGLRADRGFIDLLTDSRLPLSSVLLRTNVPNLSILPAGTPNVRSHELLASGAMRSLLNDLASRSASCVVIFDSPALLLTTEAGTLASLAGQVLLVVAAGQTTHRAVAQAMAALEHSPVVLSVLNRSSVPMEGRRYGDYYEEVAAPPKRPGARG
jgi:protein-tyrosine kinase